MATAEPGGAARDTYCAEVGYGEKVWRKRRLQKQREESDPMARRRDANRTEAREECELQRVLSCCSGDHGWRAKLDFGSGKPLDDLHRASTLGAVPEIGRVFGGRDVLSGFRLLFRAEQVKAKR